ncbi:NAD(P)H-dependent flavin oxidoreductase [Ruegeria arenilitoris]|uniref:NAD(P)H-dependent flavin oxidoreductase n=1 Tax=Ruegeria arenilitoris TaxID=1173585 RepID=UPI001C2BC244
MEQKLQTRLTEMLGIEHPILLAPMDLVSGGKLAAAVTSAGGLGLIGGGYGNLDWMNTEFEEAGNQAVGVGFITWSLLQQPGLLEQTLKLNPKVLMLSFGDGTEAVEKAKEAGVPTLWQVQRLEQAKAAIAAGVDIIVVQGQEGGGHGMDRGLTALLPAVRDLAGPEQVIVAAGGIADGRGLAAALMLGADGVMMGTRFWASKEAIGSEKAKQLLVETKGDDTVRSKVFDVTRGLDWPWHFTGRVVSNDFAKKWHSEIEALKQDAENQRAVYEASDPNDYATRVLIAGEALDLIDTIESAEQIVEKTVSQAAELLKSSAGALVA